YEKNERTIEEVINKIWQKYCNEKKIQGNDSNIEGLYTIIRNINIEEKLSFGVIIEEMLVPLNNRKEIIKQIIAVLYQVITKIWKMIWKPSRITEYNRTNIRKWIATDENKKIGSPLQKL
ncbi:20077_t:CDS:1, partial [Gigaspora margarita]